MIYIFEKRPILVSLIHSANLLELNLSITTSQKVDKFTLLNYPESYSNIIGHWCIYLAKPIPLLLVICFFLDISFLELMIICENEWCCSFWTFIPLIERFSQSIPSLWWHRLYKPTHSNRFWLVKHFYILIAQMI